MVPSLSLCYFVPSGFVCNVLVYDTALSLMFANLEDSSIGIDLDFVFSSSPLMITRGLISRLTSGPPD